MEKRTRWIVGLVGVLAVVLIGPASVDWIRLSLRQRQIDRQLEALKQERARLLAQQARLQTDPTYVEGLIRSTFKQARRGEYVIPMESTSSR